ncbi:4'-phosphopantetheinyl transferase superfamily protein [Elizabethkingia argentiflava]|uniref:4'-phosphopantetheinyl transferase superfamily protein n=1 Tax=Elizabethkingia argenteiflava TaxID=2681556 RepID=A0A845PZ81_9FLAO|nr:4'-phosphopantetheinyl transferase superfamily protein [Elizabethkingia argenteiflava]NAW52116.1 4'-phosphopantetheinyl transferase superfamily protein [Elizabethkingia argenteiflava]
MGLYQDYSNDKARVWIWKYDENEKMDINKLLTAQEYQKTSRYHPKKIAELLMVRHMLHQLLPGYKILYKKNGEPYLEPADYDISISHSFPLVAIAISDRKIGIDLERVQDKILKIKHKFILDEFSFIEDDKEKDYLTAIWCVKESLYKLHHSKFWSLKRNYKVEAFDLQNLDSVACKVYDETFSDNFCAQLIRVEDFFFCIVIDSPGD